MRERARPVKRAPFFVTFRAAGKAPSKRKISQKNRPRPSPWSRPTSSATCGPQTCGCRGSGPTVRKGRVLYTSLSRAQHARGGGFAGSEVRVTLQRLGGTRVAFLHAQTPTHYPPDVKPGGALPARQTHCCVCACPCSACCRFGSLLWGEY
jgi:hypothetical protein